MTRMIEKTEFQKGFTLVELLVAMAIGALLLTAIVTSFSAILQTQSRVQAYEEVQETLRFTTALMTQSLRSANEVKQASDTSLTIERRSTGATRDCLGNKVDDKETWKESFKGEGRTLVCEVDGDHLPVLVSETVAYEVESLNFECASYINNSPVDFDACGNFSSNVQRIIAVQTNIEIAMDADRTGLGHFKHLFTVTLSPDFSY